MAATFSTSLCSPVPLSGEGRGRGRGRNEQVKVWISNKSVGRRGPSSVSVRASEYQRNSGGGGGGDFIAGFVVGGALFGTLAYIFAPQIRRSILNEDEYGFRRPRRPSNIYYDEGLERTRQTLNEKIGQLNSAIDNVSSRLRGNNNSSTLPVEADPQPKSTSK